MSIGSQTLVARGAGDEEALQLLEEIGSVIRVLFPHLPSMESLQEFAFPSLEERCCSCHAAFCRPSIQRLSFWHLASTHWRAIHALQGFDSVVSSTSGPHGVVAWCSERRRAAWRRLRSALPSAGVHSAGRIPARGTSKRIQQEFHLAQGNLQEPHRRAECAGRGQSTFHHFSILELNTLVWLYWTV